MQETWQALLKDVITDPAELLDQLSLNPCLLPVAQRVAKLFPLRVPRGFVARMQKADPYDPLLRQVLPLSDEELEVNGFIQDPLQEKRTNPFPGLLHKYQGRVLLTLTGACAINCRYCFRRHFPYQENRVGGKAWEDILAYIAADSSLYEVILSGGDPLLATDNYLAKCIDDLGSLAHLKILRIHSRLPVVLPQRITAGFTECLSKTRLQPIMVIHTNHANELDDQVKVAIDSLWQKKIMVLNQAVLLKGVNDSLNALINLSQRLFEYRVLPYYLHRLDRVQGAAHFAVNDDQAMYLLNNLRKKLPGYLVPKYVYEQGGAPSKLPLF